MGALCVSALRVGARDVPSARSKTMWLWNDAPSKSEVLRMNNLQKGLAHVFWNSRSPQGFDGTSGAVPKSPRQQYKKYLHLQF